jgi:hypothetical protein
MAPVHQTCRTLLTRLTVSLAIAPALIADDRVVVQPTGQSSRVTISGRVVEYTGRELTLQTGVGAGQKRFPRSEVVEVTTAYSEPHQRGLQRFAEGRIAEADAAFTQALEDESRTWVRRSLLAAQVKCAWWTGDYTRAATRFLPIAESDPETLYFGLIPLVWTEDVPATASLAEARAWLRSPHPAARLIGASWLLTGPDRPAAEAELSKLATDTNPLIQRLAQAQSWRLRLASGPLPAMELQRWEHFTRSLPAELRGGPFFLIGRGRAQRQEALEAAAAWLWLPFEHPDQRALAAEAHQRAAEQLAAAGDLSGARTLANEVGVRYADLPIAERALRWLDGTP